MFSWYRNSALTIVHLSDISDRTSFADSIWIKRGWTLQELLASSKVLFYTQDWSLYRDCTTANHKSDGAILTELHQATGIEELHLKNFIPGVDDARSKLRWASTRHTTRAEDVAYFAFLEFFRSPYLSYMANPHQVPLTPLGGDPYTVGRCLCLRLGLEKHRRSIVAFLPASHHTPIPSGPSKHNGADLDEGRKLYGALARLSSPRFVAGRLDLPCIVHRVIKVKLLETSSATSDHDYELLEPSSRLREGSVQVYRIPKLLDLFTHDDPGSLLDWLGRPFNALLLQSPRHIEYKRIASDCPISASVEGLVSVVNSECRILEIV
ncbi:hypothetical protein EDD16DRAFT_1601478 [Pisolithus croceorrhizus]|nr:hypothetical protein EDD16DRAFT_1601478 [Pisolithus croceorrhizus]